MLQDRVEEIDKLITRFIEESGNPFKKRQLIPVNARVAIGTVIRGKYIVNKCFHLCFVVTDPEANLEELMWPGFVTILRNVYEFAEKSDTLLTAIRIQEGDFKYFDFHGAILQRVITDSTVSMNITFGVKV